MTLICIGKMLDKKYDKMTARERIQKFNTKKKTRTVVMSYVSLFFCKKRNEKSEKNIDSY